MTWLYGILIGAAGMEVVEYVRYRRHNQKLLRIRKRDAIYTVRVSDNNSPQN